MATLPDYFWVIESCPITFSATLNRLNPGSGWLTDSDFNPKNAAQVATLWVSLEVSVVRLCEVMLQQYSGAPLPQQRQLFTALAQNFKQLPMYFLDLHGQQDLKYIVQVS